MGSERNREPVRSAVESPRRLPCYQHRDERLPGPFSCSESAEQDGERSVTALLPLSRVPSQPSSCLIGEKKARWLLEADGSTEEHTTDRFIRGTTKLVVCGVAVIAAIVSYRHAYAVVTEYGESGVTAVMIPLTIDGLVYAASMVILHAARAGIKAPWLAWLLLWVGITATLAANVAHGWRHGLVGSVVAAWPAVALVGCYEMLMWLVRSNAGQIPVQAGEVTDIDRQAVQAYQESVRIGSPLSERRIAERFGKSRRWARAIMEKASNEERR
jgi:hypothetical protein